ncbi:MAG: DUF2272 domain-containing protein [Sphingomonas sp.]|uniref:DUF2272 domain-containing protein n=1 Tax=Sphingomonas sp. TaxID=28214 RepID=UPI0025FD6EC6|nr:DUF2272 domain-containing protein [Sphingomonas sp.]MBX3566161.1 DUF2272 domain-containing protein [Sphingomonas sp.]
MGDIAERLIAVAAREWDFFRRTTRHLDDHWDLGANLDEPPQTARIGEYWDAVGRPTWDGLTPEPWSAAFISWCFAEAGAGGAFRGDETHSVYVDRIRRHDGMSGKLILHDPALFSPRVGDLIWNARGERDPPGSYAEALEQLDARRFFDSHVDIVVAAGNGMCSSIGGNVWFQKVGGSVTRSDWHTDAEGRIADDRKVWIGVIQNDL